MDLKFTFLLLLTIVVFFALSIFYLKASFAVVAIERTKQALSAEYEKLREQNDILETQLREKVNLEEVYRIATEDLKMKLPDKDIIHILQKKNHSYTVILNKKKTSLEKKKDLLTKITLFINELLQ